MVGSVSVKLLAGAGLTLTVLMISNGSQGPLSLLAAQIVRYVHALCGIIWIGHIYYSNLTQAPMLERMPPEVRNAILRHVVPRGFYVTQISAIIAILTGAGTAYQAGFLVDALRLSDPFERIGAGMWLAIVMALNMWLFLRPPKNSHAGKRQIKFLGARINFSRVNLLLSVPMLFFMLNPY